MARGTVKSRWMEFTPPFGAWMKRQRKALDLTQAELAESIHYSTVLVHKVERGEVRPSRDMVDALRAQLGVPESQRDEFELFARGLELYRRVEVVPAPLTPLLGREHTLDTVVRSLGPGRARLVTLSGSPGVGKTRLAIEAAHVLAGDFAHGTVFVPLAALTDPARMPSAIADVLGSTVLNALPSLGQLQRYFSERHMLLVLDNLEHLLAGAPMLAQLLEAAPRLSVLVTSRAVLGLPGETVIDVPPLHAEAAETLFLQRAEAIKPGFADRWRGHESVREICRLLDRLPLAIELAAARSRMFTPPRLLGRLRDRSAVHFELLDAGPRPVTDRHRTLHAAIAWSNALLSDDERQVFRRLAVFAGGCALREAAEVCLGAADGPGNGDDSALEAVVQSLVDKSLVRIEDTADGPRVLMLETLREFGWAELDARGELESVRRAHAMCFLRVAEALSPKWGTIGDDSGPRMRRVLAERDNFRAALSWCQSAHGDWSIGLRLIGLLSWSVAVAIRPGAILSLDEARSWLADLPARVGALPHDAQAGVVVGLAWLFDSLGDRATCTALREMADRLTDEHGDANARLRLHSMQLADDVAQHRALDTVLAHYAQAAQDAERHGALDWAALYMGQLGYALVRMGEADRGIDLLQQWLARAAAVGEPQSAAARTVDPHNRLSLAYMIKGDYAAAFAHAEQAAAASSEIHAAVRWTYFHQAALCALAIGDHAGFERHAAEYVRMVEHIPMPRQAVNTQNYYADSVRRKQCCVVALKDAVARGAFDGYSVIALAYIASALVREGRAVEAARLGGAAQAQESLVDALPPAGAGRAYYAYRIFSVRADMGDDPEVIAAFAEGRRLTLEQAVAEALAE